MSSDRGRLISVIALFKQKGDALIAYAQEKNVGSRLCLTRKTFQEVFELIEGPYYTG